MIFLLILKAHLIIAKYSLQIGVLFFIFNSEKIPICHLKYQLN